MRVVFGDRRQPVENERLMTEKGIQLATAMHDAKYKRILVFDAVSDDVFPYGQAAVSGAEVNLPVNSDVGEVSERKEAACNGVDWPAISTPSLSLAT